MSILSHFNEYGVVVESIDWNRGFGYDEVLYSIGELQKL